MSDKRRPELPDPGEGRWWDITLDIDDDYMLRLHKSNIHSAYYDDTNPIAEKLIFKYDANAALFEREAANILRQVDEDRELFVGTYHRK